MLSLLLGSLWERYAIASTVADSWKLELESDSVGFVDFRGRAIPRFMVRDLKMAWCQISGGKTKQRYRGLQHTRKVLRDATERGAI